MAQSVYDPSYTGGGNWFTGTGGTSQASQEQSYTQNGYPNYTQNQQTQAQQAQAQGSTGSSGGEDPYQTIAKYQEYIKSIEKALEASSGWEREKYQMQRDDAQKALDNAYKIAKLQGDNQRYGYDSQRETALDQLKENQRQYDSTHALDLKKYGLQVADTYAKYASTPDQTWLLKDFTSALSNVGQDLTPTSSATEPEAHAKTWQDFAALSGYSDNPVVNSGQTQATGGSGGTTYSTQGTSGGTDTSGGQTTTTDARNTAINAVTKAIPASDSTGHNDQDYAALNAIKSLYFAAKPGSVERLGSARRKIAEAGLKRLGYDSDTVSQDYTRAGVGQQSVRAA